MPARPAPAPPAPARPARSVLTARPPSRATAAATAMPMAPAPPVIRTTLSASRVMSITQPGCGIEHHHGGGHQRHMLALSRVLGKHVAQAYHELLARTY